MYGQYNILSEIESPYREAFHSNMLASLLKEPQILQAFLKGSNRAPGGLRNNYTYCLVQTYF